MSDPGDRRQARRSARQVGVWTGLMSALILAVGVGVLTAIIFATAHVDHDHHGDGHVHLDLTVVDVDRLLPWVLALGAVGVLLLGLVAWMAARQAGAPLAEALRRQRNFVADASHELRTPLTALHTRIQVLQRRHARGQPIDDVLERLHGDAAMMDDILTEMLQVAEAGAEAHSQGTPVVDAVRAAVDTVRPLADAAGVVLTSSCPPEPVVAAPAVTLTRACVALLDNAVRHSPRGATVVVDVTVAGRSVHIRVTDQGGGIAATDLPRIFDRFSRGAATAHQRGGFGLGLALVRETAARYRGAVSVETTSADGTTFLLRLPAVTRR